MCVSYAHSSLPRSFTGSHAALLLPRLFTQSFLYQCVPSTPHLADCFADLQVYLKSEAQRWGIPLDDITHLVLDSQDSKLVDGKPLMAPDNSKFIKGPDYQPPEKKIAEKLITHFNNYNSISEKALIRSRYLDN